ncbi:hypothetical protein ACWEOE_33295 [Amycolatopsis sp. NPDC004368]
MLVPLPGHSRGHAAVAVDTGDHWVFHAGDALYHHRRLGATGRAPLALTAMERVVAHDWRQVKANHRRLAELARTAGPDLVLVDAHDPVLLHRARA